MTHNCKFNTTYVCEFREHWEEITAGELYALAEAFAQTGHADGAVYCYRRLVELEYWRSPFNFTADIRIPDKYFWEIYDFLSNEILEKGNDCNQHIISLYGKIRDYLDIEFGTGEEQCVLPCFK